MSELLDKQVNVQKELQKIFWGSCKLLQGHEKVCNENKRNKEKQYKSKNVIDGRRAFSYRACVEIV